MAVEAINRDKSIVLMTNGKVWPVANWLDQDGNECGKDDAAFAIVGPCSDIARREFWVTLELSEFQQATSH